MPRLADTDMETHKVPTGNFNYSAVKPETLGSTEFTLVTIINDVSASVGGYRDDMEASLKEIVDACNKSPRRDSLLLRHVQFNSGVSESHGFKSLENISTDDYDGFLNISGMTALYDAAADGILSMADYAQKLAEKRFEINGIVVIITDGEDNQSVLQASDVAKAIEKAKQQETLESLVVILIGINMHGSNTLSTFKDEAQIDQYVEQADASAATLAKMASFVSRSISSQSQALGTGGPSQPVTF